MAEAAADLLVRITRCPMAERCLAGEHLACSAVFNSQHADPDGFHVPEPWSGHVDISRILFVSSNPSIDHAEAYPTADSSISGESTSSSVAHGIATAVERLLVGRAQPGFGEMLSREAAPGRDFALT